MIPDNERDRVIFRRWRAAPRSILAILLDVPANPGRVMMYEHVGQHGEGDYLGVMSRTTPAAEDEPDVHALRRELAGVGYALRVVRRKADQ